MASRFKTRNIQYKDNYPAAQRKNKIQKEDKQPVSVKYIRYQKRNSKREKFKKQKIYHVDVPHSETHLKTHFQYVTQLQCNFKKKRVDEKTNRFIIHVTQIQE